MSRLRLAFLGTPDFSARILATLIAAGHEVAMVYAQPPRPAGRGHRVAASPVQRAAGAAGLAVRTAARLGQAEADDFAGLGLDAAVVAAYGLILPPAMLAAPRLGCLNVHASLLPRWRGAAPIERALLAGDPVTGVTIMHMDQGLDTGPIVLAETLPIGPATTAAALYDAIAARGGGLLLRALDGLAAGTIAPQPQPEDGATYAKKLRPDEGRLDWRRPAALLERAVRALNPAPGTWFEHRGERIKVLAAAVAPTLPEAAPGTVLDDALTVTCGEGALRLLMLQRPGRAAMTADALLRGFAIPPGTMLSCPATS
jgi:methionyl-tRNA formyltransferase